MKPAIILFFVICGIVLSSCGQYGPLTMPINSATKSGKSSSTPQSQSS